MKINAPDKLPDKIPYILIYRGVGVHAWQSPTRIDLVKCEIDKVHRLSDPEELNAYLFPDEAGISRPAEARLLAGAKLMALWDLAADNRQVRPQIDLQGLRASLSCADSLEWLSRWNYGSLLDPDAPTREHVLPEIFREMSFDFTG